MQRFKNILFVTEQDMIDKLALDRAMALAKSNSAKLTMFDVVPGASSDFSDDSQPAELHSFQDIVLTKRREQLEQMINETRIDYPGVTISIEIRAGRPFLEVIKAIQNNGHDLVIKVRETNDDVLQRVYGSTDFKLMRKCPCPVWIIKPTNRKRFSRILAAVDPDPLNPESPDRLIMDIATSLAETEKSELFVVHAWQIKNEAMLRESLIPKNEINELRRSVQLSHQHQLDLLEKYYCDHKKTVHLIPGPPGQIIPAFTKDNEIDLIVMGTVGRTGIAGLLIGNTAEKILNSVDCSVLTVKPEGFNFPV